jgi:hypothetical protein
VQDDALALLLDVDDANDTGRLQRGRAPELGRRDEGPRVRSAGDRGVELAAGAGTNVERDGVGGGSEELKAMKENLERIRQLGVEAIED